MLHNIDTDTDCASQSNGNPECQTLTHKTMVSKHNDNNSVKSNQCTKEIDAKVDVNDTNVSDMSLLNQNGELNISGNFSHSITRRGPPSINCQTDKYGLVLRFRPRHRSNIVSAHHYQTFKLWDGMNHDKVGFIPLGDLTLPPTDLKRNCKRENI